MKIIIYILANALAILAANRLISGFSFQGDYFDLAIAAAVLGVINYFIKPVVKFLTFPFIILTLGILTILINIALLNLADYLLSSLLIQGFWASFWGVVIISLVNHIILSLFKDNHRLKAKT